MIRIDRTTHMMACFHEAAHAILFHEMGFYVLGASVVRQGAKVRDSVGVTKWIDKADTDEVLWRRAIGYCAGYVCEMLACGIDRFEPDDVIRFCDNDGGYEVGYAAHICEFCLVDDAFEMVIKKAKALLLTPRIAEAVNLLAGWLHEDGQIEHGQIAIASGKVMPLYRLN